MRLWIITTVAHEIVDRYGPSHGLRSANGEAALLAGGTLREVPTETPGLDVADTWMGDHYDGATHTKDSPRRVEAAQRLAEDTEDQDLASAMRVEGGQFIADVGDITVAKIGLWYEAIDGMASLADAKVVLKNLSLFIIRMCRVINRQAGRD